MSVDYDLVVEALPAYEVREELGRGARGVVLAGRHRRLGRDVAIKQLPRAFGADALVRARFVSEARLLGSLDHPHIVPIFDFVEHEGLWTGRDTRAAHDHTAAGLKQQLEAERRESPFLIYRDAARGQVIVPVPEEGLQLVVGRGDACDLVLDWDEGVSRVHAKLDRTGDWTIAEDGLSHKGTFVNGARIHGRRRLRDGDRIQPGRTGILFRAPIQSAVRVTTDASGTPVVGTILDAQKRVLVALCRPFAERVAFATPASNQDIASELFLSVDAVKTHIRALSSKFGVEDLPQNKKRARLVELAMRRGLVTEADLSERR